MARYRFIEANNKIICISTYAKKVVKGIAKCAPNDKFDPVIGRKLAQLRCDAKIANKRADRAAEKYMEAQDWLFEATQYFYDMKDYYLNAEEDYMKTSESLEKFEKSLLS